jgi:hypothetical protein
MHTCLCKFVELAMKYLSKYVYLKFWYLTYFHFFIDLFNVFGKIVFVQIKSIFWKMKIFSCCYYNLKW